MFFSPTHFVFLYNLVDMIPRASMFLACVDALKVTVACFILYYPFLVSSICVYGLFFSLYSYI